LLRAIALAFPAGAHALPAHPALDGLLADTWCGAERTIADKDSGPRLPDYKVVYAYASDVSDRFTSFAGDIARYTKAVAAKVAMFSDKSFDRDTSCGPARHPRDQRRSAGGAHRALADGWIQAKPDPG
jgi:hypothetical protein